MTVLQLKEILSAELLCGGDHLDREVQTACGSDMMSDVLAFVKEQAVLLTGLVNPQVVRTAEMMDMKVIVFVRGKVPAMRYSTLRASWISSCSKPSLRCSPPAESSIRQA